MSNIPNDAVRGIVEDGEGNYDSTTIVLAFIGLQIERYIDLIEKNSAVGLDYLATLKEELARPE